MFRPPSPAGRRSAKVLVLVALCLVPLVGVLSIALEGGLLLDHRRHVQAAADAAALAAASDLFANWSTNAGADPSHSASAKATAIASDNGYDSTTNSTVTVNIPPVTGDHVGQAGYAEVTITYKQPRYFSRIWSTQDLPVTARAVARGRWSTFKDGIIVLDLSASEALKANGGGTVSVTNADIIVNSNDPQAIGGDGSGSWIKAINANVDEVGGVKSGTNVSPSPTQLSQPVDDPLAYLPDPPLPAVAQTAKSVQPNNPLVSTILTALGLNAQSVNKLYVLDPGRYDRLPNFTNGDVVILRQASDNSNKGIYYLNGSGFTSNGATIIMDPTGATTGGVMFYNDPQGQNSNGISITGGTVVLSPTQNSPYAGMLFFQKRTETADFSITGQGGMSINGTFYVAGGAIKITGSSSTSLDVIGSQYISRTVQTGGSGQYSVNWDPQNTARLRQVGLVE
jgi:Putative Flp pilus-assembly TadE/G-like